MLRIILLILGGALVYSLFKGIFSSEDSGVDHGESDIDRGEG